MIAAIKMTDLFTFVPENIRDQMMNDFRAKMGLRVKKYIDEVTFEVQRQIEKYSNSHTEDVSKMLKFLVPG
jgi:hypothetical protein